MAHVIFFHAHPDDEAIATGGTMAALSDRGHRVVLVTATGGELGEIPEGLLADGETLVDRRRAELEEACRILGVDHQVDLGFLDSGMAGEESNRRPGSFAAADLDEAAGLLAARLRQERADVLVIYDEHGVYGHPDHVKVHDVGRRAAELADTPVLYLATLDRDRLVALQAESDFAPPEGSGPELETMGEPGWRITTEIDVRPWIARKHEAMAAHRSQIPPDSFFLSMSDDVFTEVWGTESYIRVWPPIRDFDSGRRETDFVVERESPASAAAPTAHVDRP
jgi:LmbE family N-acetylglucosaminyl deacetylase